MTTQKDDTDNFRSTFAQLVATMAFSILGLNIGLILGMPTIVIGALRIPNPDLTLTEDEASWFGSLLFIVQPICSLMSGFIQDTLGRKTCLMLTNIPQFIGWIIIYFATSPTHMFIAIILLGLSLGFVEAPILSYIGEITQPRVRGIFTTLISLVYNMGVMVEVFMGAGLPWRDMIFYNIFSPVICCVCLCFVPESPAWLVTKGRVEDARKSYQWLRGWVKPEAVSVELETMVSYVRKTHKVNVNNAVGYTPVSTEEGGSGKARTKSTWQILLEPDILAVFRLIILFFIVAFCASLFAMRPFFIEILDNLHLPLKPHLVAAICMGLQMVGAVAMCVCIKPLGKRGLTFLSLGLSVFCCLGLGAYLLLGATFPWVPVSLFCLSYFSGSFGIIPVPWVLVIELFPLRARGVAAGICGAVGYVIMFLVTKTYYGLESLVNVSGVCFLYGGIGLLGLIYLYVDLPETEGVALEEIERRLSERRSSKRKSGKTNHGEK